MSLRETLAAVGATFKISVPTVLDSVTGKGSLERCDERLVWWSRKLLDDADVLLEVRGQENVPEGEPLVLMSNHRSYYDIPSVFCSIPGRVRMVAKKELFRVPVFGRAMLAAGFIKVDRGKRESAMQSLKLGEEMLKHGTRVWIAPEGTRSKTGELGPFKSGGFHLALDAGVRILPIALVGTEKILSADSLIVQPGAHVTVTILPPIDAPKYGQERRKELSQAVRDAIEGALATG